LPEHQQDLAERLARELAREALFLPDRWRAWLLGALSEDLDAADLEQHRHAVLNARMSEAVEILARVAEHLQLDQEQRLSLTMREFDTAPEQIRKGFSARQIAEAIRGSWQLAKSVAFTNERLPVAPERLWERSRGLARKRREASFALSAVVKWLDTNPKRKQRQDYDRWSKAYNETLKDDEKRLPQSDGVYLQWPFPWPEIVEAVEEGRLPSEKTGSEAPSEDAPIVRVSVLDPIKRAELLRDTRLAHDWSISFVAQRAGIDRSHLGKLESGEARQPSFETLAKLAQVLGIPLSSFVSSD
jgi:DNA-binding XRE family transcriptional regulator